MERSGVPERVTLRPLPEKDAAVLATNVLEMSLYRLS